MQRFEIKIDDEETFTIDDIESAMEDAYPYTDFFVKKL